MVEEGDGGVFKRVAALWYRECALLDVRASSSLQLHPLKVLKILPHTETLALFSHIYLPFHMHASLNRLQTLSSLETKTIPIYCSQLLKCFVSESFSYNLLS